ncbi:hypothetical protein Tco_1160533, partial [Tanacetum coccineum]
TANEDSLYITAKQEHEDRSDGLTATRQPSLRQLNPFAMVEPPRKVSYKEIISATENFSDSNTLSEVDFRTAYYRVLDNHDIIVKKAWDENMSCTSSRVYKRALEFRTTPPSELDTASGLNKERCSWFMIIRQTVF